VKLGKLPPKVAGLGEVAKVDRAVEFKRQLEASFGLPEHGVQLREGMHDDELPSPERDAFAGVRCDRTAERR
jgi:hypothetical protein